MYDTTFQGVIKCNMKLLNQDIIDVAVKVDNSVNVCKSCYKVGSDELVLVGGAALQK